MFDDRLKKLRESRGITQQEAAEILQINKRTYASYENNEREPNSIMLIKLAETFGVTVDYLLGYSSDISEHETDDSLKKKILDYYDKMDEEKRKELLNYVLYLKSKKEYDE